MASRGGAVEASPKAVGRLPDRPIQSNRASVAQDAAGLGGARRRLSVMSDNTLIEGVDGISMDEKGSSEGKSGTVIREYSGVSKKGYAPYNPRKKNQVLKGHKAKVRALAINRKGSLLCSAGKDVLVWDVSSLKLLHRLTVGKTIFSLAIGR